MKRSRVNRFFKQLHLLAIGFIVVLFVTSRKSVKPVDANSIVKIEAASNFRLIVQSGLNAEEPDDFPEGALCSRFTNISLSPSQLSELLLSQPVFCKRLKTKYYLNSCLPPPFQNFYNS